MKKLLLFFLILGFSPLGIAQTFYYERVAIVKDGHKQEASGDGHFITFTTSGCYDSDKDGITEDTGFRKFLRVENNIRNYYGDSYFGKAYYYFNSDCSRLNIKEEVSGIVYVYVRKSAPAGIKKSLRNKKTLPPSVPHVSPSAVGNIPPMPALESYSSSVESSSRSRYGYYTCPSCHGSGKCPICHGKHLINNGYTGHTIVCASCNNLGQCSACGGSGKKYGVVR